MKLRINGNDIRIRVNKAEFEAFMEYGSIADILEIPHAPLSYSLEKCGEKVINLSRLGDSIRIGLPMDKVEEWKSEDKIGFSEVVTLQDKSIRITVEKELKCPNPEECQADPDAFARPK